MTLRTKLKNFFKKPEAPPPSYAGRDLTILSTDTFLVSYPKSGNTWVRFLIGHLITQSNHNVTFENLEKLVPDIYRNTDTQLLAIPQPRVLKSHEIYTPSYPRIIYIIRDPRDVAISYYHHLIKVNKIDENMPLDTWLPQFLKGDFHPEFGTWKSHVDSWLNAQKTSPNFCLIKYESLLETPLETLKKIADFLNITHSESTLTQAIDLSRANRMRRLEKESGWQPFSGDMRTDKPFVRAAVAGSWKTELSAESAAIIETQWLHSLQDLY